MAPLSPTTVSLLAKNETSYVGRAIGEVLYILKCVPKRVQVRKTYTCYHELPVSDTDNRSYFESPMTHVLLDYADQVDRNLINSPMYQIEKPWVALTPLQVSQTPPDGLLPYEDSEIKI